MENTQSYTYISDAFGYDNICFCTLPCKHNIILDGEKQGLWDGVKIYKYLIKNNLKVPNHFKYCGKIYLHGKLKNWVRKGTNENEYNHRIKTHNCLSNPEKNLTLHQDLFNIALAVDNRCIIEWSMKIHNVKVTREHIETIIKRIDSNSTSLFKKFTQGYDINKLGMCYVSGGDTLLGQAVYYKNLPIIKYLIEERNAKINNGQSVPIDFAYNDMNILEYLIKHSKLQKIIYPARKIYSVFDQLLKAGLVDNSKASLKVISPIISYTKCSSEFNSQSSNQENDVQVSEYLNQCFVDNCERQLKDIVYDSNLGKQKQYYSNCCINNSIPPEIYSIKFDIKTSPPHLFERILFVDSYWNEDNVNSGNNSIQFEKLCGKDGITHFSFCPIDPLELKFCIYSVKRLIFDIGFKKGCVQDMKVEIQTGWDKFSLQPNANIIVKKLTNDILLIQESGFYSIMNKDDFEKKYKK